MTDNDYFAFCQALTGELSGNDPDVLVRTGSLRIDGMDVGLFLMPGQDDLFCCYIDVGRFDPVDRAYGFQELLKLNLLTGTKSNGVFALDPGTEHVLLVAHVPAEPSLSPHRLAAVLRSYARMAREVRDTLCHPPTAGDRESPATVHPDFC